MHSDRPYQYPDPLTSTSTNEASNIHDWLIWSIFNLCIGGLLFGLIPLSLSIECRDKKKKNDIVNAKRKSTQALIANIVVTILGIIAYIILICVIVITSKSVE